MFADCQAGVLQSPSISLNQVFISVMCIFSVSVNVLAQLLEYDLVIANQLIA